MKRKPLEVTFHNPNPPEDSEKSAMDFVSRASQGLLKKEILRQADKKSKDKNITFKSSLTMDEIEENFEKTDVYSGIMQGLNEALGNDNK